MIGHENLVLGESLGSVEQILANTPPESRDPTKPWLLAPVDLQAGKAAGVRRLGRERKPEEQGREGGTVPWGKTRTFSIEETGGLAQPDGRKEGPFFGGQGRVLGDLVQLIPSLAVRASASA